MNTAHQITFRALLFSAVLLAVSCSGGGGGNSNPTTPTPQNPVVAITSFTASLSQTASENQYSVHISARETAGQSPATLGALEFTLADANGATARATPDSVWSSTRLGPGTTVAARDMMLTGSREAQPVFTRLTARVVYTNDAQVSSSVTETIDIQQPQGPPPQTTFTIAGVVSGRAGREGDCRRLGRCRRWPQRGSLGHDRRQRLLQYPRPSRGELHTARNEVWLRDDRPRAYVVGGYPSRSAHADLGPRASAANARATHAADSNATAAAG